MDDIVATAVRNFHSALSDPADRLPDAGPRWGTIAAWCREKIPTFTTAEEVVHFAQDPLGHGSFECRFTGEELVRSVAEQDTALRLAFPQFAPHFASFHEPDISRPISTMIFDGRRVSNPMFVHLRIYFSCVSRIPRMDSVCEIGGGFGAPARLFLTNSYRRPQKYVLVDLPESLFFAEAYLRATLGADRVHYVEAGERLHPSKGATVILCPLTRLAALKTFRFDLVINTCSMGEMTDEYVAFYRDWLSQQPASYFYSFNRFMRSQVDRGESANVFCPRLGNCWRIEWSDFVGSPPASFADILARRVPALTARWRRSVTARRKFARPLAPTSMYLLLHAADNARDARLPYRLLSAMTEDFGPLPNEAFFLCQRIAELEQARPELTATELKWVDAIRSELGDRLSTSENGRVPPHLVDIQRERYPLRLPHSP